MTRTKTQSESYERWLQSSMISEGLANDADWDDESSREGLSQACSIANEQYESARSGWPDDYCGGWRGAPEIASRSEGGERSSPGCAVAALIPVAGLLVGLVELIRWLA